jgi:CheY-like chemotaxis protein
MAAVKILVVDDEPVLRELLVFDFQNKGFETCEAGNPTEALDQLKNTHIDAVVSDIRMPGGGGLQLLKEIKSQPAAPYVVFITGFADLTVESAMDEGAEGYFKKPIDRRALTQKIEFLLRPLEQRWSQKIALPANPPQITVDETQKEATLQIGRGGFSYLSPEANFKIKDLVKFKISIANGLLEGTGQVQWTRMSKDSGQLMIGVEFLELPSNSVSQLLGHLVTHPTASYIPRGTK